jgi:hypothetical protein
VAQKGDKRVPPTHLLIWTKPLLQLYGACHSACGPVLVRVNELLLQRVIVTKDFALESWRGSYALSACR